MGRKPTKPGSFSTVSINGKTYFRTRIQKPDGKSISIYGKTEEELLRKREKAMKEVARLQTLRNEPTVAEYSEKWLVMHSARVQPSTLKGYARTVRKFIIEPLGDMFLSDVTADDIKMAMVPVSKLSSHTYSTVNMLMKSIFYSAEHNELISNNPTRTLNAKGGKPPKEKEPLTDQQVKVLLDTIRDLPPYAFVMLGLYAGLRREEILALKWDCVFLDSEVSYISVRRAWHPAANRPEITQELKTPSAKRDIPIPKCLVDCLKEEKERSVSEYVIADSEGNPLSGSQYARLWNYIRVRSTKERFIYKHVNGQTIKIPFKPVLGQRSANRKSLVFCIDFDITPHLLRHTYITNLIHEGVDPKTVQYLAGHKNSKVTMDVYAKVKYNKPEELSASINAAFKQQI